MAATRSPRDWDDFERLHAAKLANASPFETKFEQRVLRRVPDLSPSIVSPQQVFRDRRGGSYFMDFAIVEEPFVHIALEVDGYDKTGRGTGMTRREFIAWLRREAELKSQGWHVLRFANGDFTAQPDDAVRLIDLTLRESRQIADERRQVQEGRTRLSDRERLELERLRAAALAENERIRGALERAEAENTRMWKVAAALGLVFAAALIAIALVVRGGAPSAAPGVSSTPTPTSASRATTPTGGRCPAGYPIKGNIQQQGGTKIYHSPGGAFYNETNPERCFVDAAAAEAEGFRASLR